MSAAATEQPPAEEKPVGFWDEMQSLKTPARKDVQPVPKIGAVAPTSSQIPLSDGKPTVILFLRHCGCPFAEKTFKALSAISDKHKEINCIAVSHSTPAHTEKWIPMVGGAWSVNTIVDEDRDLYAQWGLGVASAWHVLSPWVISSVFRLGKQENIWNLPTESGNRWQTAGAFAVGADGLVKYTQVSRTADDLPDFDAVLKALGIEKKE